MKTLAQTESRQQYFTARRLATIALLGAISIVMSATPLGYIPIGVLQVTLMHIPVIIAGIIEGPVAGMIVGLIFGVSSIFVGLGTVMAPVFINPLVSVFPRVMIGLVSAYVYRALSKASAVRGQMMDRPDRPWWLSLRKFRDICAAPVAAAAGTFTNTAGVLGMIYLVAAPQFVQANKAITMDGLGKALLVTGLTNGSAEIAAAIIVVTAVVKGINRIRK